MAEDEDQLKPGSPGSPGEEHLIQRALRQEFGNKPFPRPAEHLPEHIGPYKILRRIGAGGMGVVYEAEQTEPTRRVALKVTRNPADGESRHLRLFRREIDVLARLQHPSIARIYDAGRTTEGQPYFVMELIEGLPLIEYCDGAGLSIRERLSLFAKICQAVNYAHQRGVIHRDLKPGNILVDHQGVPHILDFGLARILDPDMEVTLSLAGADALVGTLPYMSPEQTQTGTVDIDIRTDVYSLGVILYEMLTGRYPYTVVGQLAEVLRNIAEAEPARPSSIHRKINNEVETIVLRALAKDRERRYPSAEALGSDIQHYLAGEPIDAKRDSAIYVLRKLAARHYFQTSVIAALVATIVGFGVISFELLQRAQASEEHLKKTNGEFAVYVTDLEGRLEQAAANTGQHLFGYFLLEWHAGRVDAARQIQRLIPRQSPEFAVTAFLLDDGVSEDDLRTTPHIGESLVLFATGERYLKVKQWDQARQVFTQYARQYRGLYLPLVEARLEEIASHTER